MTKGSAFEKISALCLIALFSALSTISHAQTSSQWRLVSQRDEIAPQSWLDAEVRFQGSETLALAGGGKAHADGRWVRIVPAEPAKHYRFRTHFLAQNVDEVDRSVFARLVWLDSAGNQVGPTEYPSTRRGTDSDWRNVDDVYASPEGAAGAELQLVYRWDADGVVRFSEASLEEVPMPHPRLVSMATIRYRPREDLSLQENMDRFAVLIAEAAERGADIVTLPEGITLAGSGKTYIEVSEPVPGPTTEFLGEVARKHGVYVVAGILEREGEIVYNTAVLLDREGKVAGSYRKVSLPREEYDGGVTPGDSFPTFETDFGRIGIMICWDVTFPEPARRLASNGAEIILMPIWGGNTTLARARAIENQIYLVSSSYDMETGIFDKEGNLAAEATDADPVAVYQVDLNERLNWPWLGDFRNRIPREAPAGKR